MRWFYELRGPKYDLLVGSGHATRAEAEHAAESVKKKWSSGDLQKLLHVRIGVANRE